MRRCRYRSACSYIELLVLLGLATQKRVHVNLIAELENGLKEKGTYDMDRQYISVEVAIMIAADLFKKQYGASEELAEGEAHVVEFSNCILVCEKRNGRMEFGFIEGVPIRINKGVHIETLDKVPIDVSFPE